MSKLAISMSEEEIKSFIDYIEGKKTVLLNKYGNILKLLQSYDEQIANLKGTLLKSNPSIFKENNIIPNNAIKIYENDNGSYPNEKSYLHKLNYILKNNPNGLTMRQMINKVVEIEKIPTTPEELKRVYFNINQTLVVGYKINKVYERRKEDKGKYIYSLK